jgi:starch synthase
VLLGSATPGWKRPSAPPRRTPGVAVHIGYDEGLSHRIIAGGDAILCRRGSSPAA